MLSSWWFSIQIGHPRTCFCNGIMLQSKPPPQSGSPNGREVGCPRNKPIFFRFEPKQTETQSVLVVFRFVSQNQIKFFSVCFGVSDRYRNYQNKQNFVETNWKNLKKKCSLLGGPQNRVVFQYAFLRNQHFFPVCFSLFQCFGPVSKQPKQTELMVWGIKKVDIWTNLLLFRSVFCLFQLLRNNETPCFD